VSATRNVKKRQRTAVAVFRPCPCKGEYASADCLQVAPLTARSIERPGDRARIAALGSRCKGEAAATSSCFGGARIAHSLIRERLIDEYRLTVHPVMLGEGLPLMKGLPEPQRLEAISSTAYADGTVAQVLRPS
jgi:riboflavin biosynthesis pyrimidine reductase